ncbi:MAG: hypothetical protein HN341_11775 [Verrucomicrobia bacterium]|jgi:plasmid stability protein|nr:hypothetical protein [Verrucomicrobiota bacterium]
MSTITIKDIPGDLHAALKVRAKAHGRSLNKEVITTLEGVVHGSPVDASAITHHARAVRETMDVYITEKELNAFKHVGRK